MCVNGFLDGHTAFTPDTRPPRSARRLIQEIKDEIEERRAEGRVRDHGREAIPKTPSKFRQGFKQDRQPALGVLPGGMRG
jgi:hypothetical protein